MVTQSSITLYPVITYIHEAYKDYTGGIQGEYRGITRGIQGDYRGMARDSWACCDWRGWQEPGEGPGKAAKSDFGLGLSACAGLADSIYQGSGAAGELGPI